MTDMPQNPETQEDLLEKLLAGAAERETKRAMNELAQKGTVTKAEFSTALSEFENRLLERIDSAFADKLQKAQIAPDAEADVVEPIAKAGRKSTITASSDPREENPVRYLLQKGRSGAAYDDVDKALVWGLTYKALTTGMSTADIDGDDFGDR